MSPAPTGPGQARQDPAPSWQGGATATQSNATATPDLPSGPTDAGRPRAGGLAARYAPAGAAAAAMVALGLWGLARDSSMGNDEVATRWAALLSLHQLAHLLNTVDAVHGLYYLLMHGWMAVGTSPAVLRIPSLISMAAAVALTAILARRLTGSGWAGLFAGLVVALTPSISFYAQTARSYALVFACVLGATLALLHALNAEVTGASGSVIARRWLAYGALVTLSGYLNELSLLLLAAHAVTVLLARYGRQALQRWAAAAVAGAVLVTPLIVISLREQGAVNWIPRPGLTDLRILFQDYFGATLVAVLLVLACAIAAVLPPAGWWRRSPGAAVSAQSGSRARSGVGAVADSGARSGVGVAGSGAGSGANVEPGAPWWRGGGVSLPSVAAPLLLVPAILLFGESLITTPLYVDRYVLYGEAGAALLAGAGMYRIGRWLAGVAGRRELAWGLGVAVCVCALLVQIAPQQRARTPQSRAFDFGGPSRYVGAQARPGDGVLFFGTFYRKARLGYPADFAKTSDFAMAISPQQAGTFRGRDKPFSLISTLMLGYERIWVIGKAPSQQLPPGQLRAESLVLGSHFSLRLSRRFRGMQVTLWLRR